MSHLYLLTAEQFSDLMVNVILRTFRYTGGRNWTLATLRITHPARAGVVERVQAEYRRRKNGVPHWLAGYQWLIGHRWAG